MVEHIRRFVLEDQPRLIDKYAPAKVRSTLNPLGQAKEDLVHDIDEVIDFLGHMKDRINQNLPERRIARLQPLVEYVIKSSKVFDGALRAANTGHGDADRPELDRRQVAACPLNP